MKLDNLDHPLKFIFKEREIWTVIIFYDGDIGIFGFGYILDRFFVFCAGNLWSFSFGVLRGLLSFFSIWFPVFVKSTNGFADLICDVVWVFSFLGSGFSSVWAEIMRLHWSRIIAKPMYASLFTSCTRPIRVLTTGMWRLIKRFWRFCKRFSVLINFFRGFAVLHDFLNGFAVSNAELSVSLLCVLFIRIIILITI